MITTKTRLRQLVSDKRAHHAILASMSALLCDQLGSKVHPLFSRADVDALVTTSNDLVERVDTLCERVGFEPKDEKIVEVLGSEEGEKLAREVWTLSRKLATLVEAWDDRHAGGLMQLESAEATPRVVRERSLAHQFTSLCRQAETLAETVHAVRAQHYLQFWVWNGDFEYSGKPKNEKVEG